MSSKFAALILCLFPITLAAQVTGAVTAGYVTAVNPDGGFEVEGWPIELDSKATYFVRNNTGADTSVNAFRPFVGEFLDVYGERSKGKSAPRLIHATRLFQIVPAANSVHGTAIIDLVPQHDAMNPDHILRTDGRFLRILATAKLKFDDQLTADTAFHTHIWIDYEATPQEDATFLVERATFRKNVVKASEEKLHKKEEYDPSAVRPDEHQSGISKLFHGLDVKKLHPHPDSDLQARIGRIGESLVPAYQRALAPDDPTRLNFRFQVVDFDGYNEPFSLPNGIVLIPFGGLDRLKSDSEIAAPIAIAIAFALEKEQVRGQPAKNKLNSAKGVGYLAGILVPGVGLAGDISTELTQNHLDNLQIEQAGRVALCLMHDAGLDLQLAPIALWLSNSEKPEPREKIKMPRTAANLYKSLGTTWKPGSLANAN